MSSILARPISFPDREMIEAFFGALWPDGAPGRIAICHHNPKGEFAVASLAQSIEDAVTVTLRAAQYSCVWHGIGAIRSDKEYGRGEFNDVVAIPGIWFEIDYGKPGGPPDIDTAIDVAKSMPLQPTMLVRTGHGIHCYWLFKEAWTLAGSADRGLAQGLLLAWRNQLVKEMARRGFAAPDAVSDLPRVFRPAGTENCKDPSCRLPITIVHQDETSRYIPSDFEPFIPEALEADHAEPSSLVDDPDWLVRPGDEFNAKEDWHGVAKRIGWTSKQLPNGRIELLRSACEKYGAPSSSFTGKTGYKGRERITIFSGNCGLKSEPDTLGRRPSYSKFELFAAVQFPREDRPGEGDFTAATRSLVASGFGKPRPKPSEAAVDNSRVIKKLTLGELLEQFPMMRHPVIDGWLREGETGNIIASSKVGKSWLAYYLALSFVTCRLIFGRFGTAGGKVLLIDNELHPETLASRLKAVMTAMRIDHADIAQWLEIWPLRGNLCSIFELTAELRSVETNTYKLIILDAKYRMIGPDADENSNSDETRFYNEVDRLGAATNAAVLMIHHSTKGSQSEKRVTDVGSGAGAQSRAADLHLVLREHQEDGAVVLEAAVRSFPPIDPLCLRFRFPLWEVEEELDCNQLKGKQSLREEKQEKLDDEAQGLVLDVDGWNTRPQLKTATGLGYGRLDRATAKLINAGLLEAQDLKRDGKRGPSTVRMYRKTLSARGKNHET